MRTSGIDGLVALCASALSAAPSALLVDLDGTLSPIVADPSAAEVLPASRDALLALSGHLDLVAVLSGRDPDVARAMVGLESIEYFGAHGLARWKAQGTELDAEVASFVDPLRRIAPTVRAIARAEGLAVEEKALAIAVHFRNAGLAKDPGPRLAGLLRDMARGTGLAVIEGRKVVEVRPPRPYGKGWRLTRLAEERGLRSLVYIGDDTTDMDACAALCSWRQVSPDRRGVALAVASDEAPEGLYALADGVVPDVHAVGELLGRVADSLG